MINDNTLLVAYADAQAMLARIEERRKLSPIRRPWKIRCFIAERQALAWIDATAVDVDTFSIDGRGHVGGAEFDLTHWRQAVGKSITLEMLATDGAGLLDWLGVEEQDATVPFRASPIASRADILRAVEAWQRIVGTLPPAPPLLHAAHLAHLWWRRTPIGRGDAVASFLIGDRHGPGRFDASFGGLVALGFQINGAAWKIADPQTFERLWLQAISQGARHHLDQEMRLRAYADRAAAHVAARRRPGRLKDVILMALSRPHITSRLVADRLGLTSAGAIKLLTIAADAGLLVERSGQSSYRSYTIPVGHLPAPIPASHAFSDDATRDFWAED